MINLTDLTDEFAAAPVAASRLTAMSRIKAVLARASDAIVAARYEQANRIVLGHLARLDDAALTRMGMEPTEIQAVRSGTWRAAIPA
jgi:hypothetical protein